MPRNPILAKLFRMVRIAENAGYGFDKMETNWEEYNSTSPEYETEFDSVIVSFPLFHKSRKETRDNEYVSHGNKYSHDSESLRKSFGVIAEKLSGLITANSLHNDEIIRTLENSAHLFFLHLNHSFGKASEKLRNDICRIRRLS